MIRNAIPSDAKTIAPLLIAAMEELASKYVNNKDPYQAIPLFEHFVFQAGNQYSFENILVYCENNVPAGVINGYDGYKFHELREPFLNYLASQYSLEIAFEDETQSGEFYIDALSVSPSARGKGVGRKLLNAMIELAKINHYPTIGLLVNLDNDRAYKLYENMGFKVVGTKSLLGDPYYHMQKDT